jgi:hypothetical protein
MALSYSLSALTAAFDEEMLPILASSLKRGNDCRNGFDNLLIFGICRSSGAGQQPF